MPAAARATQTRSRARREPTTATARGPQNSIVTATPMGILDRATKKHEFIAARTSPSPTQLSSAGREAPRMRAAEAQKQDRAEDDPHRDGRQRPVIANQDRGQPAAALDRQGSDQDEQLGRNGIQAP